MTEATHCEAERLDIEFNQFIFDCAFCGTSVLSVSGSAPYNAVYGRAPRMLPDIHVQIDEAMPGTMRHAAHARDKCAGASQARAKRALVAKTRPVGTATIAS